MPVLSVLRDLSLALGSSLLLPRKILLRMLSQEVGCIIVEIGVTEGGPVLRDGAELVLADLNDKSVTSGG